MQMAMEAQSIMKRLGEIKAKLSRRKIYFQSNQSRDLSVGVESSVSEGVHGRYPMERSNSAWNKPNSVLPGAFSLGKTPYTSSSFSTHPEYLNVTALSSDSYSSLQAPGVIPEVIPRTVERQNLKTTSSLGMDLREDAPLSPPKKAASMHHTRTMKVETPYIKDNRVEISRGQVSFHKPDAFPHAMNYSRSTVSDSSVSEEDKVFASHERPKVTPWALGTPGRLDHGIGVIVKPLHSMPTLEPIASLDHSSSSELSPILTADDTSVNAFDYPLTKQPGNKGGVFTPSLLDDTMLDTSSIEDSLEAAEFGVLGVGEGKDTISDCSNNVFASPSSSRQRSSMMDFFACGSFALVPGTDPCFSKEKVHDGKSKCCIEMAACDEATNRESYSLQSFLQSFDFTEPWSG